MEFGYTLFRWLGEINKGASALSYHKLSLAMENTFRSLIMAGYA
jgi:hypothetical protein